jgi:hypothetical protein
MCIVFEYDGTLYGHFPFFANEHHISHGLAERFLTINDLAALTGDERYLANALKVRPRSRQSSSLISRYFSVLGGLFLNVLGRAASRLCRSPNV